MNGGRGGWDALDDVINGAPPRRARSWADLDEVLGQPTPAGVLTAGDQQAPVQAVPELLRQALAVFDDAGIEKMHSETLATELGMASTHELNKLLVQLEVRTLPEAFHVAGKRARGYHREHLVGAADRIASGEQEVPDEVAEWPAA
jgi:hypothetical protein